MDGMIVILTGIAVFIGGMITLYLMRPVERIEKQKEKKTLSQKLSQILLRVLAVIIILVVAYYALVILALTSCIDSTC